MKKYYKNKWIIGVISIFFIATLAYAGTATRFPYGLRVADEGAAHSTPPSGFGDVYVSSDIPYWINDSGVSTSMIAGATATDFDLAADAPKTPLKILSVKRFFATIKKANRTNEARTKAKR